MKRSESPSGVLYIVATPIGNLKDITLRALEVLQQVDLVATEDTRHSRLLFKHYAIKTPMTALHNYNETKVSTTLCQQLALGKNIALISDAGTPLISDPGYHLVQSARALNFPVVPIPGACAAITALCAAGFPTDKFIFEGFLPAKPTQQLKYLKSLAEQPYPLIFYEAPHRLLTTLANMAQAFGETREMVVAKELTKVHETIYPGTIAQIQQWLQAEPQRQKGEFVLLVKGATGTVREDAEIFRTLQILAASLPTKQAAALTAQLTGANKNQLYQLLVASAEENCQGALKSLL